MRCSLQGVDVPKAYLGLDQRHSIAGISGHCKDSRGHSSHRLMKEAGNAAQLCVPRGLTLRKQYKSWVRQTATVPRYYIVARAAERYGRRVH